MGAREDAPELLECPEKMNESWLAGSVFALVVPVSRVLWLLGDAFAQVPPELCYLEVGSGAIQLWR